MRARPAHPIPLFDRKPVNPFAPIGISAAVARSVGQGWPQAGARALPLTEASTVARSRSVRGGARARGLIITAIVLAMTGGSISAVSAASVKTQSAPVVATNPLDRYAADIAEASRRFGIPESWIRAVMRVESRGQVKAVSPKGAIGLMQIMPDTWADCACATGSGAIPVIRTTTFWRVRLTYARCTIASARRAFSRPTTPAPAAMRSILRQAARCPRKRSPMSQPLRR